MMNAKELLFLARLLEIREENNKRTISFMFNSFGLFAYIHSAVGRYCEECTLYNNCTNEQTIEEAYQKVKEYERTWEEALEEQKLAISYDAEQDGITVGTNA